MNDIIVHDNSPAGIMRAGTAGGMKLAEIKEMYALQKEYEADKARKDHFADFARFKESAPKIKHDKFNPRFKSGYTSLGNLLDTYEKPLAICGLHLEFPTPVQTETEMTVTCRRVHKHGHTEDFSMTGPIDKAAIGKQSGQASRNPMQDIRSTFTYLRSATVESALGVAGTEATHDDNGNDAGQGAGEPEYVTKEQITELEIIIEEKNIDLPKLLEHWKVEALDQVQKDAFSICMRALKKAAPRAKETEREPGSDDE